MRLDELLSRLDSMDLLAQAKAIRETLPPGVSLREAGRILGRDKRWIDRRFRLLRMDPAIQGLAERGVLGEYILEEISRLPPEDQLAAADKEVRARERPERIPKHKTEPQVRGMLEKLIDAEITGLPCLLCAWFVGKASDEEIDECLKRSSDA